MTDAVCRWLLCLTTVTCLGWWTLSGEAAEPAEPPGLRIGQSLPAAAAELELQTLSGGLQTLGDLWREGGVLLVFASNTCPYVLDWMDRFPPLATAAEEHQVAFLLINSNARRRTSDDSPAAMAELAAEQSFAFPYLVDPESRLADALGAQRTPEVFLFDGQRHLVYRGAIDDHSGDIAEVGEHWARDALRQLTAGESIGVPWTQPLGCAVQRPRKRRPASGG